MITPLLESSPIPGFLRAQAELAHRFDRPARSVARSISATGASHLRRASWPGGHQVPIKYRQIAQCADIRRYSPGVTLLTGIAIKYPSSTGAGPGGRSERDVTHQLGAGARVSVHAWAAAATGGIHPFLASTSHARLI